MLMRARKEGNGISNSGCRKDTRRTGPFAQVHMVVHNLQHLIIKHAAKVGSSYQREQIGH